MDSKTNFKSEMNDDWVFQAEIWSIIRLILFMAHY